MVPVINMKYMHYLGKIPVETAKKEVQDTSCRGSVGVPQLNKIPQEPLD